MKSLRVALETQFSVGTPTGLGVYAAGLARGLRSLGDVDVVELKDERYDLWRFDRRVYWDQIAAPRRAAHARADVVHFTGGTLPAALPHPVVLTLHDLVWLRGANRGRFYVRWYFGGIQPALARRADALVVDTNAARADVAGGLGIDPARIHVTGVGVDEAFFALERRVADPPFVLSAGTVEERKDLVTAVRALARIPTMRLVACGPLTPYAQEVRSVARQCGVAERVELRGYVDDETLLDLYSRAAMFVFPSRYEGFGLPPLQALACGLPVVAARIPTALEVLGDAAVLVEPGDVEGFAAALSAALSVFSPERVERGRWRARSHTWESVARRMADVYRCVVSSVGSKKTAR